MMNAAIVTNPMDIGADRGVSAGSQKSQPGTPLFDAVLNTEINGSQDQPREAPKSGAEAMSPSDQSVHQLVQVVDSQTQAADAVTASVVHYQALSVQLPVELAVDEAPNLQAAEAPADAVVDRSAQETVSVRTFAYVPVEESLEDAAAGTRKDAPEAPVMLEEGISENLPKDAEARSRFFGMTPKEIAQALVDSQMSANAGSSGPAIIHADKVSVERAPRVRSEENPLPVQPQYPAEHAVSSGGLLSAVLKPVEGIARDMTYSQQVIAAIMQDTEAKSDMAQAFTGHDSTGSENTGTSQPHVNAQDALFAIPGRVSFESVIRGLDTAQVEAPSSSNTETHTKVIDQIVREIRLRQFQGGSDLMVKLNPAELGQIRLQISRTAEGMTSQIHTSSEQVRGLLQAHLPALTEALTNAGLKMDQVTVTSGASFSSLMQENAFGHAYQQRNNQRHSHTGGQEMSFDPALMNAANNAALAGSAGYSWLA